MNLFNLPNIPGPLLTTLGTLPNEVLFLVSHGSTLYGTATPSSDTDLVAVYLPTPKQIALQEKPNLQKLRFNREGVLREETKGGLLTRLKAGSDKDTIEVDLLSFPDLVSGFILGTPKEVEIACYLQTAREKLILFRYFTRQARALNFLSQVGDQMKALNVSPLVSFAKKNVDYISEKAIRYNSYLAIQAWVQKCYLEGGKKTEKLGGNLLLDLLSQKIPGVFPSRLSGGHAFYVFESGLSAFRSLDDLDRHAAAVLAKYGERSVKASELGYDTKGLGHGIRCLIQAKEILLTGFIRYPLKDAELLTRVKTGEVSAEEAQRILLEKFAEIQGLLLGIKGYPDLLIQSQDAAYKYVSDNMLAFYQLLFKE